MKNKKEVGMKIFIAICIIIVAVCIVIQLIVNNETKQLEKRSEELDTLITQTKGGEQIETQYTHVEDNKFFLKIPTNFYQLDYDTIIQKYSGDIPDIVFSNDEININIVINMTENNMKNDEIVDFNNQMKDIMKNNSEIISTNCYTVDGHNVGQIKLMSNATDTNIYNNMICFSYEDKLVIITFNCTEALRDEWENVGDFIIDSLFFTDNN